MIKLITFNGLHGMSEIKMIICAVCGEKVKPKLLSTDARRFSCCGTFDLSRTLSTMELTDTQKQVLSQRITNANKKGEIPIFNSNDIRQ